MPPFVASCTTLGPPLDKEQFSPDSEVIEVALLLPRWQALALEDVARQRGMSSGQMLRRIIGSTVASQSSRSSS